MFDPLKPQEIIQSPASYIPLKDGSEASYIPQKRVSADVPNDTGNRKPPANENVPDDEVSLPHKPVQPDTGFFFFFFDILQSIKRGLNTVSEPIVSGFKKAASYVSSGYDWLKNKVLSPFRPGPVMTGEDLTLGDIDNLPKDLKILHNKLKLVNNKYPDSGYTKNCANCSIAADKTISSGSRVPAKPADIGF